MRIFTGVVAALVLVGSAGAVWAGEAAPPVAVEGGVLFTFAARGVRSVHLAGEFNGWDPGALPMSDDDGDGVWEVVVDLQPSRTYQYKFVVNGGEYWKEDPTNPYTVDDGYGGYNTVVSLTDDGEVVLGPLEREAGTPVEPVVDHLEPLGNPLYVAIVWHQHQPKYLKDLETGEYLEPWVRLHAIKDYYDMVAILDDYPDIHLTVNLTPVLLTQLEEIIEGYETGTGTDRYLRMTLKDAAELDTDDKLFLLTHFFNANWDNMIHVWPRYKSLKDMKRGDSRAQLLASAAAFTEQDWRDLQAWFNLAWFDPDFQEGDVTLPDGTVVTVSHLIGKSEGYTEADKREIVETQMAILRSVVPIHLEMQERGQLEVITTPFYHPILPLICDTQLARVAMPSIRLPEKRFSFPEDARAQVEKAFDYYVRLFGREPSGLWPAEGAVAQEIVGTVADAGFRWMASDDQVLQYSLGGHPLSPEERYSMYWVSDGASELAMLFRDHRLSDEIGFNFRKMDGVEAANSMMRSLYDIHRRFASTDEPHIVPIILDGENAWEWYKHDGKEFFHSWYAQMSRAEWLRTVTVAEYVSEHPPTRRIDHLWAGSWISHNFATWIGEPEENTAWEYLATVRSDLARAVESGAFDAATVGRAYGEMLAAEGSDWFWWYGADQTSPNEAAFDKIFRGTLENVYRILGMETPGFLDESILAAPPTIHAAQGGVMARAEGEPRPPAGPIKTDAGYMFSFDDPSATTVNLAGDFNGWSTSATPMSDDDGDGVWTVVIELAPGRYEYKFVVDGGARWVEDPGNSESVPDPYGGRNSVLVAE